MDIDKETFTSMLKERLSSTDINMVKRDVFSFIQNPKEVDIWSNDYFLQLADRIKFLQGD
jgi:tRNA U34 5-methylaminomethyl-2-thiouridine-forming methyltransferase MnmC